jgi:phage regulator Rha-like protein
MKLEIIQNKIFEIRGQKVMFDFDLAQLFETETRILKQSVKRNIERFPENFMFQLSPNEWQELITNCDILPANVKFTRVLPLAFTEHGVTMLASVLKSKRAIQMNIAIVTAFIEMKKQLSQYTELAQKIHALESLNNSQFLEIYEALENLINDTEKLKIIQKNKTDFENRERIGFKTGRK